MDGGRRVVGRLGAAGVGSSRSRSTRRTAASSDANLLHVVRHQLRQMEAHVEDLYAELTTLRAAAQYVVDSLGAGDPASRLHNRLLHVPNQQRVLVKRAIRRAAVVSVAMAEACTGTDCSALHGFPEDAPLGHQNLQRFHPTGVAVEALVTVEEIFNGAD